MRSISIRNTFLLIFYLPINVFSQARDAVHHTNLEKNVDLMAKLHQPPTTRSEAFNQAIAQLELLQKAPSCNRLATATLIDSCQTLESDEQANEELDRIKSTFAARLAVCELITAHADLPPECIPLAPQTRKGRGSLRCLVPGSHCDRSHDEASIEYSSTTFARTKQCLQAMEKRPQWWTSYSNARQNGISICHAARAETDKDELLQTHRSVTSLFSQISSILHDNVKDSSDELSKVIKNFQEELVRDLQTVTKSSQYTITSLTTDIENRLSALLAGALEKIRGAGREAEALTSRLQQTSKAQTQAWASQKDLARVTKESLESIHQRQISNIAAAIERLHGELRASSELIAATSIRHDERLQSLDEVFNKLSASTLMLRSLQEAQANNHTRMMESMHLRVKDAETSISLVNHKLASLGEVIDDKARAVSAIRYGGIGKQFLSILAIAALALVNLKVAAGFTAVAALGELFSSSQVTSQVAVHVQAATQALLQSLIATPGMVREYWPALLPIMAMVVMVLLFLPKAVILLTGQNTSKGVWLP